MSTDINITDDEDATMRIGQFVRNYVLLETDETLGRDDVFTEVDEGHHELWVHNLPSTDFGEELESEIRRFGEEATSEFAKALLFETNVSEYNEESNEDGYVLHVGDVRFNDPDN